MPFDAEEYRADMVREHDRLLTSAASHNKLYFLLNLLNLWGRHGPVGDRQTASSMDFNAQINTLTNTLILDRLRVGGRAPVPEHEALFIYQLNMEQKGFYAALRNFVRICTDEKCSREPWRDDEWSPRTSLRTGAIVNNLFLGPATK